MERPRSLRCRLGIHKWEAVDSFLKIAGVPVKVIRCARCGKYEDSFGDTIAKVVEPNTNKKDL